MHPKKRTKDGRPARITIITPVYNESAGLAAYAEAVQNTLFSLKDYEIRVLFVEDGSLDDSWARIQEICRQDSRFTGVRLSRNFGSHIALSAGIDLADGDAVVTLACDLQDPLEAVLQFLEKWREGYDIVWGKRQTRQDAKWRIKTSNFFHYLLKRYAMPQHSRFTTGSFLLMDRKVADSFRHFRENNRITFALVAWTGFDQAVVHYDRTSRSHGVSSWNFSKMMKAMYDSFIGFSILPVRLITISGVFFFMLSVAVTAYLSFSWFFGRPVPGWTSLMATLSMLFGLLFLMLSIIGEYLHRIYSEVVSRPLYFISARTIDDEDEV